MTCPQNPHTYLGAEYFTRLHPDRAKKRAIHQLEALGYHITLDHAS